MRKSIIIGMTALAMTLSLTPIANALEYVVANQLTIKWLAVDPNNAGEQIEYAVYTAAPGAKASAVKLWQGTELEYTVKFTSESLYHFGVETLRLVDVNGTMTNVSKSEIGWSDDPTVAPVPFGASYFLPPSKVGGLEPK